jgi:hypothetical protein
VSVALINVVRAANSSPDTPAQKEKREVLTPSGRTPFFFVVGFLDFTLALHRTEG